MEKEATGRTLDEAKKAAAEALGVSVNECDFEILQEATSKGLFAKSNFRVKATVKEKRSSAKAAVDLQAPETEPQADERPEPVATDSDGKAAVKLVQGIFDSAGLDIKTELESVGGKYANLQLSGKDVEHLTTNKGAALDSLQYLSNAMLGRELANGVRLTLDAAGYRSSRAAALEKLALDVANAVVQRKQEAVLDALPAHERRVIHSALKDFAGIETYSEGEEPDRHIVISPKK